jgi:signal transduction histidine kinase
VLSGRLLNFLPNEAARLLRAANELALARDLPTVTAIIRTTARELTDADGITFVLREGGQCHYVDEDAIQPLWKGKRFPMQACVSGWVMVNGQPVVIPDIYADHRVLHDAYRLTFVKSMAMVPVRSPDAIGAIGAYWATPHHASDEEMAMLMLLADSAALALANVQLYAETRAAFARERDAHVSAERARFEAEQATAAKDEFVALVSHELRQPLHAAMAALRMLTAAKNAREDSERAHVILERQLTTMTSLVEDLLDASRIVRGQIELHKQPVDVCALVQRVAEGLQGLMRERQHDFEMALPDVPVVVDADVGRIQQVLTNLLGNAIKYTDPGGRITVSIVTSHFDAAISIRDTGHGIDSAVLPRIFDLFARGSRQAKGFGVGLAVARRLVELHGGTLEARSEGVGRGSEFVVRLLTVPLAAA